MNIKEYRSLLGRLPIKSPTPLEMEMLCPHLTHAEAVRAFTTGSGSIALPPLRVRNSYQIVSYHNEWVEGLTVPRVRKVKNHPAQLEYLFARRTLESYADRKPHGDIFSPHEYMDRAMRFAENNWGEDLILDDWDCATTFYIQDPSDLVNDRHHAGYPRTKMVLYVTLNRDYNTIINEHHKPESVLFDEAISQMTLDPFTWQELKGGRGGFSDYNCALCGTGLHLTECPNCVHQFSCNSLRCGSRTPLSRKMVDFLRENGHEFRVDPELAWQKERARWERRKK